MLVSVDDYREGILAGLEPLDPITLPLADSHGCVLADDVVAQGVGWPEGGDRVGREMALGFDAVEQGDAISVEFARLLAAFRVVGNSNEPRLLHPTG